MKITDIFTITSSKVLRSDNFKFAILSLALARPCTILAVVREITHIYKSHEKRYNLESSREFAQDLLHDF
jgi:hypothetical protein